MKEVTSAPVSPESPVVKPHSLTRLVAMLFLKSFGLALVITLVMLVLTAAGVAWWANTKYQAFLQAANISSETFIQTVKQGWNSEPTNTDGQVVFLLLGVDTLKTRGDVPPLTDTMMLLSLDVKKGSASALSLPRDLWNEEYQTKINALYFYGQERYPENPEQFPTEVIEGMTGIDIHHTVVLSLDEVQALIDLVGGVPVSVTAGFTDPAFPRTDVDVTVVRDPKLLYETVVFTEGTETMTGDRALKFIRSRHSEGDQGTDNARGLRQQQVIQALAQRLQNPKQYLDNPSLAGQLYAYYTQNFADDIAVTEVISLLKAIYPYRDSLAFTQHTLSVETKEQPGVIYNPPLSKTEKQWVYKIKSPEEFSQEVQAKLLGKLP